MALGRIVHYAVDAVLVSTIITGIRRSSGFAVDTTLISDPTMCSFADRFLGVGETIFDMATATSVKSDYFRKGSRR
ncbi:DUF1748-domain-containing protein [Suillus lakei]|nr:DUF1748-domain-containing protein [Suillus lakei]